MFIPKFPTNLEKADDIPVHKKKINIGNSRPVSILPTLTKTYVLCTDGQMIFYFNPFFSKYQYGFCQGNSSKWRTFVDNGQAGGAILTALSKVFDCINHDLVIAKLGEYGFRYESPRFI